jgi:hypothetical protein
MYGVHVANDGAVHFEVRVIIHEVQSFKWVQGTAKKKASTNTLNSMVTFF